MARRHLLWGTRLATLLLLLALPLALADVRQVRDVAGDARAACGREGRRRHRRRRPAPLPLVCCCRRQIEPLVSLRSCCSQLLESGVKGAVIGGSNAPKR